MSDFLNVLTHGRKLQGAVKSLTVEELEQVCFKLNKIVVKRKEKEAALIKAQQEKRKKAAEIKKQMEAAGLDLKDIEAFSEEIQQAKPTKKRPIKYKLIDSKGHETLWTGIGRMPVVFKDALNSGHKLDEFLI